MPLSTGHILNNRYRIVNLLGQGGFGAVYKAWDLNLSRQCALKENLDTTQEAQKQFNREAVILAGLIHPNLARVTDYFFVPNQGQYLVMDYVEGNDLQEILDQKGPQPEAQVTEWIGQICDALDHLHTQQPPIIHRDIKPANIKITPKGKAVLVDFGVAKVWDPSLRTTQGARAITPGFSPFEQYGQAPTDARTDVYALGATAYCLLTGQPPTEAIIRVANPRISEPKEFQPSISDNLNQTILKALELLPDQRFQSAEEFKQSLFNKNTSIATAPVAPAVKTTSVQPPRPAPIPVAATARVLPDSVVPGKSHPANHKPASRPTQGKKILLWAGGLLGVAAIGVVAVVLIINAIGKSASVEPTRETEVTLTAEIAATELTEAVSLPSATPIPINSVFGEMTQLGNGRPVIGQYSPDGILYVLGAGGSIQVFQAQTGIFIREIPCQKMSVTAMAISADSELLVVGEQNWFYVYDLTNGTLLNEFDVNLPNASNLSLNPSGTKMAIASGKDLYVFALSSGAQLNKLSGHTSAISSIVWNPVKDVIYTSSFDNTIKTWEPELGALVDSIDAYSDESGYISQITLEPFWCNPGGSLYIREDISYRTSDRTGNWCVGYLQWIFRTNGFFRR